MRRILSPLLPTIVKKFIYFSLLFRFFYKKNLTSVYAQIRFLKELLKPLHF